MGGWEESGEVTMSEGVCLGRSLRVSLESRFLKTTLLYWTSRHWRDVDQWVLDSSL